MVYICSNEIIREGGPMMTAKKTLLAATAAVTALVATPAMAADLGRPVLKAPLPPPAPVYTWTGCYLGGGSGYGMWNQDNFAVHEIGGLATTSQTTTAGGRGGFGTVQVGCDYQFSGDWVIGAFADWDFGSLSGETDLSNERWFGTEKQIMGRRRSGGLSRSAATLGICVGGLHSSKFPRVRAFLYE